MDFPLSLQFLGATGTVTGSKYLLSRGRSRLMLDCGLFQGFKQLRLRNWAPLPVPPAGIDAVVLTHAHLDHTGYLPLLVREGFRGKVFCSAATRELCQILLPDSGRLLEEEANYANRHQFSRHSPALPLYTEADAQRALEYLEPVALGHEFEAAHGMHVQLQPAGHILGAASALVRTGGTRLLFSGDLGRPNDPIMLPPAPPPECDYLVLESTYGNRTHDPSDQAAALGEIINRTAARGGVTIIPSFAVGRAQTLLHLIAQLKASGAIPAMLPVYLDSPMAVDATKLYARHRNELKVPVSGGAQVINSVQESIDIDQRQVPMVIIAASGMATGGRVLHHLKAFAGDHRNTILFVGFQAAGTRGAAMLDGATSIKIHGEYVTVRAKVEQIGNLSAHADANEIMDWLAQAKQPPRQVYVTHGEPAAADALRHRIKESLGWPCRVPEYLETVRLE